MNTEQKAVILGLASIVIGFAALINEIYRIYILILYPFFLFLYLISSYVNKIDKNEKEIKALKRKIDIHERLSKLEVKVFE